MILTHSIKVCLATEPCDLRKSFDTVGSKNSADPEMPIIVQFCRDFESWSESNLSRLKCRFASPILAI